MKLRAAKLRTPSQWVSVGLAQQIVEGKDIRSDLTPIAFSPGLRGANAAATRHRTRLWFLRGMV